MLVWSFINSNTTLVKVKLIKFPCASELSLIQIQHLLKLNSFLFPPSNFCTPIQIQHLLKLNARKINLYDFHYTIKSIDTQGF